MAGTLDYSEYEIVCPCCLEKINVMKEIIREDDLN